MTVTTNPDKIRENRLRRVAQRQGLALLKSRRRDPRALDFGCYVLIDPATNGIVLGAITGRYDLTLDDIESFLDLRLHAEGCGDGQCDDLMPMTGMGSAWRLAEYQLGPDAFRCRINERACEIMRGER